DFYNQTVFDAFGTNGVGSSLNVRQAYGGTRSDNSIQYFLPPGIGGLYASAMVAAAEGGTNLDRGGRVLSGRIGFAAGPFNVAAAAGETRFYGTGLRQKTYNVGGSYGFGIFKLMGYYDRENLDTSHEDMWSLSGIISMGQGEIRIGYDRSKLNRDVGGDTTLDQIKATYQYNLSKRTAMYTTISRLDNKDATSFGVAGGSSITAAPKAGGSSKGFELGVRHFF
ncbi:MAG: porin, partial [Caldimonas sp.]